VVANTDRKIIKGMKDDFMVKWVSLKLLGPYREGLILIGPYRKFSLTYVSCRDWIAT
jgi:hypothetical protein